MPLPPPLPARTITLLGPTASGKTALAVALARSLDAEILSIDSRMVYRELDIGCGKDRAEYGAGPTAVPVHLLDLCGLDLEFSLYDFQLAAMDVIDRLTRRGKRALLCGGSGLYLDCLLAGYRLESAAPDAGLRDPGNPLDAGELEALYHARVAAPHNSTDTTSRERLLRAIEVAGSQSEDVPRQRGSAGHAGLVLGLRPSRELLRTRIRARLEARLAQGLVEEGRQLLALGHSRERLERLGLEYRWLMRLLSGTIGDQEFVDGLEIAIRHFARRQLMWFRRMQRQGLRIHWLDLEEGQDPARDLLAQALELVAAHAE
ncbi:MAG: tRNA (adenosine(37)-N6)-dimethylallyltransferase MiaA [Calditrichaeota bacterium]|nr:tRNA (adenosine(37)-N6)-dimethylallyltransferase MiaA [Calditrichota bacterium]MCB9473993.1 tRNA (adenosine(37)-N6)-dimethylallyltransferase MiaA [Candidatus Delongbacteria bacterium]